ncbi:uncharacterized protein L969DRAFT_16058 [Mixia osmundae IAM 14324]|uniref:NAD(+) diphosphatase n=1 Tax=Mixia osmundae (strain CBS 9802 / IAM 14324 / JCM 22182 / KY 12970) TaxID=764103 RepID=G7E5P7_MIXOS|nr:uncharacterized protein L969DRAFT_16058 [Mixia osmundae IAM 14324]KEI40694.1 hypothetical protein L969DRAFT_16058 [Mixia osmundae IAM 14324]GAA98157.1 hypothetical protein E5Q_04840 [Mixia osmundae IAM 14324]
MAQPAANYYSGSFLNRVSWLRQDTKYIEKSLKSERAKIILLNHFDPLVVAQTGGDAQGLALLAWDNIKAHLPEPAFLNDKELGSFTVDEQDKKPLIVFLGIDERARASKQDALPTSTHPDGPAYFALESTLLPDLNESTLQRFKDRDPQYLHMRAGSAVLSMHDVAIAGQARALMEWHRRNRFCPSCGRATAPVWAGYKRTCPPPAPATDEKKPPCTTSRGAHASQYPRTDPVTIMAIVHPTENKVLLGKQASWPKGFYSCLAGFLEPGESLEESVKREVHEESGLRIKDVRYHSSQPWPYPGSLMLGAICVAEEGSQIRTDLDNELEDARWVDVSDVRAALGSKRSALSRHEVDKMDSAGQAKVLGHGEDAQQQSDKPTIRLPPKTAIAHVLLAAIANGEVSMGGVQADTTLKGNL